jgi:putative transposase
MRRPTSAYVGYLHGIQIAWRVNEQWLQALHQARTAISIWRQDYNEVRPTGGLGRMPPAQFAKTHREDAGDASGPAFNTNKID